jgi:peroxiredoxin
MYPHERSLVKRLEGKPFALLGINSDPKDRLRQTIKKEKMTWRSWWDGGNTEGPIASQWNVRSWPTTYILDHKGVIRYKGPREKAMDEAVDKLLNELEQEQRKSPKK